MNETEPLIEEKKISYKQIIFLTIPWFAIWFHATILSLIITPNQVEHYSGLQDKGFSFGIVSFVCGIVGSFITPLIGSLSDKTQTSWGKRKPWIIFGVIFNTFVGILLSFSPSLAFFCIWNESRCIYYDSGLCSVVLTYT